MSRTFHRLFHALGLRIRSMRQATGASLQELADQAQLSRRFLVEIEAGRANPSLEKLARLSVALRIPLREMLDLPTHAARADRIALLGLRGAGKSTIGPLLAGALEVPFHELDKLIEQQAGLSTAEIFELEGPEGYLAREAEALEGWLARHGTGVLALPGGIVQHPDAFDRLLSTCTTVWLKASPQDHWDRVVAQGDTRPMRGTKEEAMRHLKDLHARRAELYQRADVTVDTTRRSPEDCVEELRGALQAPEGSWSR